MGLKQPRKKKELRATTFLLLYHPVKQKREMCPVKNITPVTHRGALLTKSGFGANLFH